jgi:A/G-specific adenine glycosylase
MDYGVMLKQRHVNPSRRSTHHRRQSPFRGSDREVRGMILRVLLAAPHSSAGELSERLHVGRERIASVLGGLTREGLVIGKGRRYTVA